jgi:hypothetical protein
VHVAKRKSPASAARRRVGAPRGPRGNAARAKHDATRAFHNRIAVVFDWDETLGPNSFDYLLESYGVDPVRFRKRRVRPLADAGWDITLAEMYCLIAESRSRDDRLTRGHFRRVGRTLQTYRGVPGMFDAIRREARRIVKDIQVEFYLLTCGFLDLHRHAPVAKEFTAAWGSEFYFNEDDEIEFAKQVITFQEKTLYLMAMAKGLPAAGPNEPEDVYRHVAEEDMHVPFDQIVYVGDGASDMPTFALMHQHGGLAVGVTKPDGGRDWAGYAHVWEERQVQNLAPADFSRGSELLRSILLCVASIAKKVELRRLGRGE